MGFDWDAHNLFHISMRDVSREEAEQALTLAPIFVQRSIRGGEVRSLYAGRTTAGRILAVVTTPRGNLVRVVTAFTAGRRIRAEYPKEGERDETA